MIKKYLLLTAAFLCTSLLFSQDDLLGELDNEATDSSYELPAFKAMKIGNLQSTKIADQGDLYLIVSHRFGALKEGLDTFFGLDEANTKIQLLYSFWDGIQFSVSRESYNRTFAAAVKYRLARQSAKFPFNIVGYSTMNINTLVDETAFPALQSADRNSFAHQLLISKRFSEKFSFQVAPTYVRENLQNLNVLSEAKHNQFAVGFGGRYKLSKRVSFNAEYVYNTSRVKNNPFSDSYAFGLDIETGGHVFQLLFTNAQSTNEPGFINNAEGDILFGFNVVRVF
ncbi:hypothetical protein OD91_1955 [Lutibacter sp. Hel_I_33_5]|uniref:DUF5777 family beta-barrel protein n=1 Tax=Lutibacter sp. Hel_I_33_5 TaxID=1566289 RepID=UPI0011AAA560|nr:DUF5777 family beta-barrel protein [Lutibacter sp. Hel_I_33_5]TVZ56659.1 hypothetical protein OD91_1955 [Lutibacter sp. Hel_I_33_5]